jgi:hypothetical protein
MALPNNGIHPTPRQHPGSPINDFLTTGDDIAAKGQRKNNPRHWSAAFLQQARFKYSLFYGP